MNSPAATSSIVDSTNCAVTKPVRNLAAARAPAGWPAWSFSVEIRSARVLLSAGKIPKSRPVKTEIPMVKSTTDGSSVNCTAFTASGGSKAPMPPSVHRATTRPAEPPMSARRHDSVSSWASR